MRTVISPLLSSEDVSKATCLCRTALHYAVKRGDFPRPVKVGLRRLAWRAEDVQQWIDSRPVAAVGVNNGR